MQMDRLLAHVDFDRHLLFQLARQGLFIGLAFLNASPGELPQQGERCGSRALGDQVAATLFFDHRSNHSDVAPGHVPW